MGDLVLFLAGHLRVGAVAAVAAQDALRADGTEEPHDDGAGQPVSRLDAQSGVVATRTGPAELGEGVGGSSGGDVDNVEGPLRCRVVT